MNKHGDLLEKSKFIFLGDCVGRKNTALSMTIIFL